MIILFFKYNKLNYYFLNSIISNDNLNLMIDYAQFSFFLTTEME